MGCLKGLSAIGDNLLVDDKMEDIENKDIYNNYHCCEQMAVQWDVDDNKQCCQTKDGEQGLMLCHAGAEQFVMDMILVCLEDGLVVP